MVKKAINHNKGERKNKGFSKPQPETFKQEKAGKMTKEEQKIYMPQPGSLMAGLLDLLEGGDIEDEGPWFPDCLKPK